MKTAADAATDLTAKYSKQTQQVFQSTPKLGVTSNFSPSIDCSTNARGSGAFPNSSSPIPTINEKTFKDQFGIFSFPNSTSNKTNIIDNNTSNASNLKNNPKVSLTNVPSVSSNMNATSFTFNGNILKNVSFSTGSINGAAPISGTGGSTNSTIPSCSIESNVISPDFVSNTFQQTNYIHSTTESDKSIGFTQDTDFLSERGLPTESDCGRLSPGGVEGEEAIAELQLQTARKLRQLLPTNRELLHLVQERNWIPLLLGWLHLNDRPAVQIEALWALTNIAGLSPHSPPPPPPPPLAMDGNFHNGTTQPPQIREALESSIAAAAAMAAAAQCGNTGMGIQPHTAINESFTIPGQHGQNSKFNGPNIGGSNNFKIVPTPAKLPKDATFLGNIAGTGSINMFGTNSGVPNPATQSNNNWMPPSSLPPNYNILLHHPSSIPTLVALLSSPHREVHEQAMWILGSVVVAAAHNGCGTMSGTANCNVRGSSHMNGVNNSIPVGPNSSPPTNGSGSNATSSSATAGAAAAREAVIAAGIVGPLCQCLTANPGNVSLQRIGSWLLSNLVLPVAESSGSNAVPNNNSSNICSLPPTNSLTTMPRDAKNGNIGGCNDCDKDAEGTRTENGELDSNLKKKEGIDVQSILPTLRRLLNMSDPDVLSHTCWALSHLCDGPSSHISAVVTSTQVPSMHLGGYGFVPRLVDLLLHPSWRVTKPALRTIGNVVCAECNDEPTSAGCACVSPPPDFTEIILACGAVPRLKELITHSNREIQKEACWTLSNIAAGTIDQIQTVIDSGAIPPLVSLARDSSTDQEVRSEACWVVLNATSCGSDEQIEVLVAEGCVSVLGVLLREASMVMMALEGLERVLQVEEAREISMRNAIGENNTTPLQSSSNSSTALVSASLIEALEQHKNQQVSKRAGRIWKQHFVNCALCRQSFSRHRSCEARFCSECKCHVCSSCNCEVYHLSFQEEFWAATEEKTQAKNKAKKSKKQKKKGKKKGKKSTGTQDETYESLNDESNTVDASKKSVGPSSVTIGSSLNGNCRSTDFHNEDDSFARSSSVSSADSRRIATGGPLSNDLSSSITADRRSKAGSITKARGQGKNKPKGSGTKVKRTSRVNSDKDLPPINKASGKKIHVLEKKKVCKDPERNVNSTKRVKDTSESVDLVLYLQQTGSIIALAKLMDALGYDEIDDTEEVPLNELDEYDAELQMLNRQHVLSRQAIT